MNYEFPRTSAAQSEARGKTPRVLVLTHSHPRLTHGGAEIAAEALVRGLRKYFGVETWLLGCSRKAETERLGLDLSQPFGADDFVYQAKDSFQHFKFANRDVKFPKMLAALLEELRPDVLHFHHYTNFGVEAFAIAKRALPNVRIALTLHEYLAICHNHGQMVKTKTTQLCDASGPIDCNRCFPDIAPRDFFLRERYVKAFFEDVDLFISPSEFLKDRYVKWGLAADRIGVLENVPPERDPTPRTPATAPVFEIPSDTGEASERDVRIGFFGQMSPLKGISVIFEAAKELAARKVDNLTIELFGDYSNQPAEFQKVVVAALAQEQSNVRYHGAYENAKVHRLMRSVDAVLVPSTWWENSPVVIQEALTNGVPVICSDIGGMAEHVRPGLDGLWFDARDGLSLARLLAGLARSPGTLEELAKTVRRPRSVETVVRAHLEAYGGIGGGVGELGSEKSAARKGH